MPYVSTDHHRVRSYELDSYAHANNAAIMQWLEHGRSKLLEDFGLSYNLIEGRWGVRFVLVGSTVNFREGLLLGNIVQISTTVKQMGTTSVTFAQKIHRVEKDQSLTLAADCETTIVFTDLPMQESRPIPQDFRTLYG